MRHFIHLISAHYLKYPARREHYDPAVARLKFFTQQFKNSDE